jgi:hypothetical protein
MSALHNALLPPASPHATVPKVVVDEKKVARSVADLTKIALQLHLKQLEAKQRAMHPEASQPQPLVQQPLAINTPGQHMPRAVAAIAEGSWAIFLHPHLIFCGQPSPFEFHLLSFSRSGSRCATATRKGHLIAF